MAKQVIVLNRSEGPNANVWTVLYWLAVPVARWPYYADPNATSRFKLASTPEVDAIKAGQIIEQSDVHSPPPGWSLAQVQQALQDEWQKRQDALTNSNTLARYGSYWDGTSWVAGSM